MIKRYNLVSKEGSFAANGYCVLSTQESETGAWVKYEDYEQHLKALNTEIRLLHIALRAAEEDASKNSWDHPMGGTQWGI